MATILLDFCILYLETIPFRYRDRLKKVKNVKYYSFCSAQNLHRHFSTV